MSSDLERWLSLAKTPQTRARIRRWTALRSVFLVLAIVSAGAFALGFVGLMVLALAGLFIPALRFLTDAPWWIVPSALVALIALTIPWCVASLLLEAARYADGTETFGRITGVVDTTSDIEDQPQYALTITADLRAGRSICREVRTSESVEPRVGQTVRFRHNTEAPEDVEDILLLGIVDDTARRRRR
ncbi:hypothetical protein QF046_001088 [Microbacterium sp. W4I4]|uniref:hypothetical protein n=1 Tax=Microbacterium sp. W4I4 TaxID=3042295 RepID=UPI00278857DD|nr:hypothetical protein [Microbacterium sp. W4I4]MDQ0613447.1 hypothetical protein [Microbacterium sp. W4I4]